MLVATRQVLGMMSIFNRYRMLIEPRIVMKISALARADMATKMMRRPELNVPAAS
jgi:hypothetical protein